MRSTSASSNGRPAIWIDNGNPLTEYPEQTLSVGNSVTENGEVRFGLPHRPKIKPNVHSASKRGARFR